MRALLVLVWMGSVSIGSAQSSFQAFQKAAAVLRHPRCLNCHIPGDAPLVGSKGETHGMRVMRGIDGLGAPVMRCGSCHQATNGELQHSPPGSVEWQLPPAKTKMAWVGLSDSQLCRLLLDAKQNGGVGRDKMIHHMESDPRVLWAWSPGPGREPPLMPHREFVELVRMWINSGGSCAP